MAVGGVMGAFIEGRRSVSDLQAQQQSTLAQIQAMEINKRKMAAEDELAMREGQFRTDLGEGQFDTPAVPAQEAVYGDNETTYTMTSPAQAAVPSQLNLKQAGLEAYKRGLISYKDLLSGMKEEKVGADPDKWRQFLLAKTPEGGSYKGTFDQFVSLSANIYAGAMAPLRAEQTRTISHDDWLKERAVDYTTPATTFAVTDKKGKVHNFSTKAKADFFERNRSK